MKIAKIFIPKQIPVLLLLAIILNIGRVLVFHSEYFLYLLWNIFLAVLPFVVSSVLFFYTKSDKLPKPLFIIGAIIWLLLLPNAPYIITDIVHIGRSHSILVFYDTIMVFTCAWVGLLLGLHSISQIDKIIQIKYGPKIAALSIPLLILFASFGMYLGRFLRFNSWDILSNHISLVGKIWSVLSHPQIYSDAYIFTGITFLFIYISYRASQYTLEEPQNNA